MIYKSGACSDDDFAWIKDDDSFFFKQDIKVNKAVAIIFGEGFSRWTLHSNEKYET